MTSSPLSFHLLLLRSLYSSHLALLADPCTWSALSNLRVSRLLFPLLGMLLTRYLHGLHFFSDIHSVITSVNPALTILLQLQSSATLHFSSPGMCYLYSIFLQIVYCLLFSSRMQISLGHCFFMAVSPMSGTVSAPDIDCRNEQCGNRTCYSKGCIFSDIFVTD